MQHCSCTWHRMLAHPACQLAAFSSGVNFHISVKGTVVVVLFTSSTFFKLRGTAFHQNCSHIFIAKARSGTHHRKLHLCRGIGRCRSRRGGRSCGSNISSSSGTQSRRVRYCRCMRMPLPLITPGSMPGPTRPLAERAAMNMRQPGESPTRAKSTYGQPSPGSIPLKSPPMLVTSSCVAPHRAE